VLRFLTDNDYPPFNYLDEEGTLTGFNVDVARALCLELDVTCDLKTGAWDDLLPALGRGETDAVIASLAITPESLADADFTERYYAMPARFVARKDAPRREMTPEGLEGRKIAVVAGSAHEAYLAAFFRDSLVVAYDSDIAARDALAKGEVDALFGDGFALAFWTNGTTSAGCCELQGGPFADERFFGDGVGIAVRKHDYELRQQLDRAIAKLRTSGRLEELFLRYFPVQAY
jgi:polar amino acid transport system substrate-binding protein